MRSNSLALTSFLTIFQSGVSVVYPYDRIIFVPNISAMFAAYKCRMIACACLASLHCAGFASWPFPVTVNRPACAGIVFSHVCLKIACQWQCRAAMMSGGMHCLCVLRLPASDIAKSHWLHLFLLLSSLECEFVCASGCLPVPVKRVWVHCLPEITPWLMVTVMFM